MEWLVNRIMFTFRQIPIEMNELHYPPAMGQIVENKKLLTKFFFLDMTQSHMNGAPNETRTHLRRFANLAC